MSELLKSQSYIFYCSEKSITFNWWWLVNRRNDKKIPRIYSYLHNCYLDCVMPCGLGQDTMSIWKLTYCAKNSAGTCGEMGLSTGRHKNYCEESIYNAFSLRRRYIHLVIKKKQQCQLWRGNLVLPLYWSRPLQLLPNPVARTGACCSSVISCDSDAFVQWSKTLFMACTAVIPSPHSPGGSVLPPL